MRKLGNSAVLLCKCSASRRVVCPALAGPHRRPAPLTGVHTVDTFSVTEPVTVIHCMSSVDRVQDADAAASPLISVLVATGRGRRRCGTCRATRRGEATRVGSPGRVPRRSNRSAPSARLRGRIIHPRVSSALLTQSTPACSCPRTVLGAPRSGALAQTCRRVHRYSSGATSRCATHCSGSGCGKHRRAVVAAASLPVRGRSRGPGRRIAAARGRAHGTHRPCPLTCVERWRSSGEG